MGPGEGVLGRRRAGRRRAAGAERGRGRKGAAGAGAPPSTPALPSWGCGTPLGRIPAPGLASEGGGAHAAAGTGAAQAASWNIPLEVLPSLGANSALLLPAGEENPSAAAPAFPGSERRAALPG